MTDTTDIAGPSGRKVTLQEVVTDQPGQGLAYRFRFVAPGISRHGDDAAFEQVSRDMEHLCTVYALPRVAVGGPLPSQIIISLADRPTEFGQAAPEATQFFEAFNIDGETCVLEDY